MISQDKRMLYCHFTSKYIQTFFSSSLKYICIKGRHKGWITFCSEYVLIESMWRTLTRRPTYCDSSVLKCRNHLFPDQQRLCGFLFILRAACVACCAEKGRTKKEAFNRGAAGCDDLWPLWNPPSEREKEQSYFGRLKKRTLIQRSLIKKNINELILYDVIL